MLRGNTGGHHSYRPLTRDPLTAVRQKEVRPVTSGTAIGAIRNLATQDRVEYVLVTEARPLLQGTRLTAWELAEVGIPHRLCVDSATPAVLARGLVDGVLVDAAGSPSMARRPPRSAHKDWPSPLPGPVSPSWWQHPSRRPSA